MPGSKQGRRVLHAEKPGSGDQNYISNLVASKEWGDLELELEILKELGADPLVMSPPNQRPPVYGIRYIFPCAECILHHA